MLPVSSYVNYFVKNWDDSPDEFPVFNRRYNSEEQIFREGKFDEIQGELNQLRSKKNIKILRNTDAGNTLFPVFRKFMENVFDFEADQLEIILADEFRNVSKDFFYQARKFAPELSVENIYQGLRNVWIMNGLQLMMGLPVEITPSVFAYSMIYPFSDNLLDDNNITQEEKHLFSHRFNLRLHGESLSPCNDTEQQLFRLVNMMEEQYPRHRYPGVYESLYAIQQGQTNSLKLFNNCDLDESQLKAICFEKGGSSVLADGYLVAGALTGEQEMALFGYGIYLQLLDDIQDIKEDTLAGTRTLYACCSNTVNIESRINKTFHFGRKVLRALKCFEGTEMSKMLILMNHSIEAMLIEAIGINTNGFSEAWIQNLEMHSPLRFDFLKDKKSKSKSQRLDLFKKYFESIPEVVSR